MNLFWGLKKTKSKKDKEPKNEQSNTLPSGINGAQETSVPPEPFFEELPFCLEKQYGESFTLRSNNMLDLYESDALGLGPPDLVHITASDSYHEDLETGQFLHATGVSVNDPTMAIELMELFNESICMTDSEVKKNIAMKRNIATYCTFNLFAKVDIRIRYDFEEKSHQISLFDCVTNNIISLETFAKSANENEEAGTDINDIIKRLWDEVFVTSGIRTLLTNTDNMRRFPDMIQLPFSINSNIFPRLTYQKVIVMFCHYIPRCLETGWDTTKSIYPTIVHNHLTAAILTLLSVIPKLTSLALETLNDLSLRDPNNELYYRIVAIAIMRQDSSNDVTMIREIYHTLNPLLPMLDKLDSSELNSSLQLINCITDLLYLQTSFLIANEDYESALPLAKFSTELASDSFAAWFFLTKCYIHFEQYDNALLAINSMPHLLNVDRIKLALAYDSMRLDYYRRPLCIKKNDIPDLTSYEENHICTSTSLKFAKEKDIPKLVFGRTVLPCQLNKKGRLDRLWDTDALELGPIYGSQSTNLINFVSPNEVNSVVDYNLLARNTIAKQLGWFHKHVYSVLIQLKDKLGWSELLELRTKVFVMEKEYSAETEFNSKDETTSKSQMSLVSTKFREKRLCERWLDDLFLDLYEDLSIATAIEKDKETVKYSGLEWELLGLTLLRICNYSDSIACLRTSMLARFDPVSCEKLLKLYIIDPASPDILAEEGIDINMDPDIILSLVLQNISFQSRFYDCLQILNRRVLLKLVTEFSMDIIRSKLSVMPNVTPGLATMINTMLAWVQEVLDDI